MMNKELLESVKADLGITGNFLDKKIEGKIHEVKNYLIDGGADKFVVNHQSSWGLIARGVDDLMGEESTLSPYFMQRATQVCIKSKEGLDEGL